MITGIAVVVIELAAVAAGVGGVTFLVYFIALVWREHREELAFLDDHVREQANRRAAHLPQPGRWRPVRTPSRSATPSRSLLHRS